MPVLFKLALAQGASSADLRASVSPIQPNGEGESAKWLLHIENAAPLGKGDLRRSIRIISDIPCNYSDGRWEGSTDTYEKLVFVEGSVDGPLSFSPSSVTFGILRTSGQSVQASLSVNKEGLLIKDEPKLNLVGDFGGLPLGQYFSVDWVQLDTSEVKVLTITFNGELPSKTGPFSGEVVFNPQDKALDRIGLRFSGIFPTARAPQ